MPCRRPTPGTRACRWAWRRSPSRCGRGTCGTIPANPHWPDRDRFVLSNGHGSMLQYAALHLSGYAVTLDDLKRFRQLHSKTPGHPELGVTPGVETTTGPLGQGLANAVGMALAEKLLAAEFNRPGHVLVDHCTYAFLGDGCLMEGISHEACSLAGTLRLGKLIALYDDNGISIDGDVRGWFTDDTPKRFAAYGWHVIADVDGHDVDAIDAAIRAARAVADRPSLVCCRTIIGKGSPNKAGTEAVHGAALGAKEVAATRAALGWPHPAVRSAAVGLRRLGCTGARCAPRRRMERAVRDVPGRVSGPRCGIRAPRCRRAASRLAQLRGCARGARECGWRDHAHAQGVAGRARASRARCCRSSSAVRRT